MVNHSPLTATGEVKVTTTAASRETFSAPSAGENEATAGTPHSAVAVEVFRGLGVPERKSAALSSVSTQPPSRRRAAVELLRVGAAALPSKKFALP